MNLKEIGDLEIFISTCTGEGHLREVVAVKSSLKKLPK